MAYSYVTGGAIAGPVDGTARRICIHRARFGRRHNLMNVTQSGDAAVAHHAAGARMLYTLSGTGWYQTSADAGSTWDYVLLEGNQTSYAQATTSGFLLGRASQVGLTKNTEVFDVTSTNDAGTAGTFFETGVVDYEVDLQGFLQSTELSLDDSQDQNSVANEQISLTIPDGNGTIAAPFRLSQGSASPDFARGGPMPAAFSGHLHDTVTLTTTIFSIASYTATIDLDTSTTGTGTLILTQMRAAFDYRQSGMVPIEFAGVYNGKVTFS